jgi:hypothetical protein
VVHREANMGLSRSIVEGVSELCARYGRAIVVEDDFVLSRNFLAYMLEALDRYSAAQEVLQVSGYMFPVSHRSKPDAFFLPLTTTWGWATWERAWKLFEWQPSGLERLNDPRIRAAFDLDDAYPYSRMLEDRLAGRNDSWGILWWWKVFSLGALVLHPRVSLLRVGGFDGSGTHCGSGPSFSDAAFDDPQWKGAITFQKDIATDSEAFGRIKHFLKGETKEPSRSLFKRLGRMIGLHDRP